MDPFKATSKISVPTVIFGVLTLLFGWMITEVVDPITQLRVGEIALVFLSLFFFSLVSDKIQEIEEKVNSIGEKKTLKKKLAGRPVS